MCSARRVKQLLKAAANKIAELRITQPEEAAKLEQFLQPTEQEFAEYRTQPLGKRPGKVTSYISYFNYWILAIFCYVPPIELSLHQNMAPQDGSSAWSFGQVRQMDS